MNDPTERSDFEARLASLKPSPNELTWKQLQAYLDESSQAGRAVALAERSRTALLGSWLGGMAVGASLMFLLLNSWRAIPPDDAPRSPVPNELANRETVTNSRNSGAEADSQAGKNPSSSLAPRAKQERVAEAPPQTLETRLAFLASQRWWLESTMLSSDAALGSKQPLMAGDHFVGVRRQAARAFAVPSYEYESGLPDSKALGDRRPENSTPNPNSSTPHRLLRDILESEGDLLL